MEKLTKTLVIVVTFLFFLSSCQGEQEKSSAAFEIHNIKLDYIFEKSEMCRGSNIILEGYLYNASAKAIDLNFVELDDFCDYYKMGSFYIETKKDSLNAILLGVGEHNNTLKPNDSLYIKLRIQVKHLYENDSLYYNFKEVFPPQNRVIGEYSKKDNKQRIEILLSENFSWNYFLDDIEYKDFNKMIDLYKKKRNNQYENLIRPRYDSNGN